MSACEDCGETTDCGYCNDSCHECLGLCWDAARSLSEELSADLARDIERGH